MLPSQAPHLVASSLWVSIADQTLYLHTVKGDVLTFPISTGRAGVGQQTGSFQTPLGHHHVASKHGDGRHPWDVLVGREPTGERCTPEAHRRSPERDWILGRILRLAGDEPGINAGGNVDTFERMIYLHGTPDLAPLGHAPSSHGCIRLAPDTMLTVYDATPLNTPVHVVPHTLHPPPRRT